MWVGVPGPWGGTATGNTLFNCPLSTQDSRTQKEAGYQGHERLVKTGKETPCGGGDGVEMWVVKELERRAYLKTPQEDPDFLQRQREALGGFYEGNATISSFFWKDYLDASALKGAKRTQEEQLGGCSKYLGGLG